VDLERLFDLLSHAVERTGPLAPVILFGASLIEYVFPPFPGDALVLLGAWYAVHGQISWPLAFAAVTAGALLGATIDWRIGRYLGARIWARTTAGWILDVERLQQFEALYRRWGPWLLVANRFLPTMRAVLFVAAGASGVRLRAVLLYGGISAVLWNVALLGAGGLVANNVDELVGLVRAYTRAATVVLVLVVGAVALRVYLKRRRASRGQAG
jgi:membrane-associated protein